MRVTTYYDHLKAENALKFKGKLLEEVLQFLTDPKIRFGITHPSDIKDIIGEKFEYNGWADKVPVAKSKLTINYMKSKCGVCFQLGNVARTYADILKLMQLHYIKAIEVGIIIVPLKIESKKLGANYAQYERLEKEIKLYNDIIAVPIFLIGISN